MSVQSVTGRELVDSLFFSRTQHHLSCLSYLEEWLQYWTPPSSMAASFIFFLTTHIQEHGKSYCPTNHSLAAAKSGFHTKDDRDWGMDLHEASSSRPTVTAYSVSTKSRVHFFLEHAK